MNLRRSVAYSLILLFTATAGLGAVQNQDPQVEVKLVAEHTALVPGRTTTVAVVFKIQSGWYIYWQNPGDEGLAPTFKWQLPSGFQVGSVRYPAPTRHVDSTGANTFILDGEPTLLADLTVPATAVPGEKVTIGVDVGWLACDKASCVQGKKPLSVQLPVVAKPEEAEESDPIFFKVARRALPAPADKAKYLSKLSAVPSVDKVGPGDKFQVSVVVEVEPGYHVNSHAPLSKNFIPTDLFTAGSPGLRFGRPEFPLGVLEKDAAGQQLSLYRDKVAIIVPVEVTGPLTGNSVEISGAVTYQACSDRTKMCFPPTAAEWRLELPVAGAAVQVAKGPELAGPAGASTSQPQEPAHRSTVAESPPSEESRSSASVRAVPQAGQPARAASAGGTGVLGRIQALLASLGIVGYLIAAFVGGLIMNVMPCVLPVISIKVLSFVQQARESRLRVLTLGLAFAAGIQVSFVLLGLLIMGLLKGVGFELQWGGQFQSPGIVIALAAVVTAFAMSLFGVFTLSPPRFVLEAGENVDQEGHVNAFGMGLLATVLGTACTAPFVSWVVAIAAGQSSVAGGMLIFIVMGFGMALPYVLLAANPGWLQFIPRPGPWLKTFEHVMGFLLLGTVAFLLNPILHQLGGQGLLWTLVFLLFVAAAAWCYGQAGFGAGSVRQATCYSGAVLLVAFGWWLSFRYATRIPELVERQRAVLRGEGVAVRPEWKNPDEIPWVPYTRQRVDDFVRAGSTVFIDYTAEWCANCKANEALFINTPEVRQAMRQRGVVPIRADHTLTDPEIEADLERFNRAGVPMYVIIPAQRPDDAILLNEILTKGAIIEGLEKAGPSAGVGMATAAGGKEMEGAGDNETERGDRGTERQEDKETRGGSSGG